MTPGRIVFGRELRSTFGFQAAARGNATYIQYMPRTLRSLRINLEKYPRFARLRSLLAAHVEELR